LSHDDSADTITFKEVRTHNLKGFDLNLPLGKISVVTGVSGSGKSSLVFDTLYGEAYRRYVESLSSYARQYLKALPKPDVRDISNLPPAIAVRQARSQATSRSTVGTATELNDLLRVVFARKAEVICYSCNQKVEKSNTETIGAFLLGKRSGEKLLICSPLSKWGKITLKELKVQLEAQGFSRLLVRTGEAGSFELVKLADVKAAALKGAAVVVDRITAENAQSGRIREAVALALKLGRGLMFVVDQVAWNKSVFSDVLDCPNCGISFIEPSETLFNHNHPLGACGTCQGFGYTSDLDWEKVIPDRSANLSEKGVIPWNFGKFAAYYSWAKTSAKKAGIDPDKTFAEYSDAEWTWLKRGDGGRFDGVEGFFEYLDSKKYKAHYRIHSARFRNYVLCAACAGSRLNPRALACQIDGRNFGDLGRMSINGIRDWVRSSGLDLSVNPTNESDGMGIADALEELQSRLNYLVKTGLAYLTLERPSRSLSGGEMQRISMARCLGSALTDSLYCLDEPSSGLHARDTDNLISIVRTLQDQGNTVVLVEHDRQMIEAADYLVELGPKAGHEGGNLVYSGKASDSRADRVQIQPGANRGFSRFVELKGAGTHNLKGINVRFPVGALTAVCGVSGSGKTSLIQHTLYPAVARQLKQTKERFETATPRFKSIGPPSVLSAHSQIMHVQQADLTRSTRSNIATYLGIMEPVRKLLSAQTQARKHGLAPGAFSFNTAGGRCEGCKGLGVVIEDLSFLGEMEVICPVCDGRRFDDRVLSVTFNGKNMTDILGMTVAEARQFFFELKDVVAICDAVVEMGLGYITLGQHTSSFSGGEAQRLKLLSVMRDLGRKKPLILILDEPSTGLSDRDVAVLIAQLRKAAAQGHTVIVVEHHLEILRNADWLVEIGPEAADQGGNLVFEGVPFDLQGVKNSVTARYLFPGGKGKDA
jgi:excinuclease ABC subunit A